MTEPSKGQVAGGSGRVLSIAKIMPRSHPKAKLLLMFHTVRSIRQAARMPGFVEAVVGPTGDGAGFAVSLWEDEASLEGYVRSGAHGESATRIRDFARAHVSCHVPWNGDGIPPWTEWGAILARQPRIIDTRHVGDLTPDQKLAGPKRWGRFPPPMRARGRVPSDVRSPA
jgi:heme-degrading monooxygenase HmoA